MHTKIFVQNIYTHICLIIQRFFNELDGALSAPKTKAQTPSMPAPPIAYATSRPAHQ